MWEVTATTVVICEVSNQDMKTEKGIQSQYSNSLLEYVLPTFSSEFESLHRIRI